MVEDVRREITAIADAARMLAAAPPGVPLPLDMLAADRFEQIGPYGREVAAALRKSARDRAALIGSERFAFWLAADGGVPRVVARLIDVLEQDRWAGLRPKVPAVVLSVVRPALGDPFDAARWVPAVDRSVLAAATAADVLEGLTAQRFLRWAVAEASRRENAGERHPGRLVVLGGWQGLASVVGATTSRKAPDELRAIVDALYSYDLVLPGGRARLLSRYDHQRRGSAGSVLELTLGDPLLPGFVHRGEGREDRALVPVLPLPPLEVVNERSRAAAARLDVLAVAEVRDRADELETHGSVVIDWSDLADRAGLPAASVAPLLERWQRDDNARWERRPGGGWTLADRPETAAALAFLRSAGRRMERGRVGGLKRARKKPD